MRPFFIAVLCSFAALFAAAWFYSEQFPNASRWIWTAAFPAFILETLFYLASVFEKSRELLAAIPGQARKALILWSTALTPYMVFAAAGHTLQRNAFLLLAGLAAVLTFWNVVLPRRVAYDAGFLVVAAAPFITRVFARIYRGPVDHFHLDILGHLMWIRLGLLSLILLRHWDPGPVSLWPRTREWRIGVAWFAVVALPLVAIALTIHDVRFAPIAGPWWRIALNGIGTFFGILWVVALGEELFFRGVIERAFLNLWRSPLPAIVISALLYAAAHLWFRNFPDWRHVLVTAVLGLACGSAYLQGGTIRASMVTHACAVTAWRLLFK
ncbi:MAG: CPBP family intramembrane metalloprotease [Acidobacteriaceae bacterium]|nr:CPBP family intramembrane metalloprotease [Acidobacteriaceae bacterium]